jgi:hypothetical protein
MQCTGVVNNAFSKTQGLLADPRSNLTPIYIKPAATLAALEFVLVNFLVAGCQARRWDRQASLNAHRLTTHRPQQNQLDPANK